MNKKIALVIAHQGFRDEEYWVPKELFLRKGLTVKTVSSQLSPAKSKFGKSADVDMLLSEVQTKDFDAILFVGGPGSKEYFDLEIAHQTARDFLQQGKLLSAICSAPVILARAGLLSGIKSTVFPSDAGDLKKGGALYTGQKVEKDGRIYTGSGPEAAEPLAQEIISYLDHLPADS